MISFLTGTVHEQTSTTLTVLTEGGVGYSVQVGRRVAAQVAVGKRVALYTYLKVSDSALDLYGFEQAGQRAFFELLLTVKSVGPKSAMNILNVGPVEDIQQAIARGDATYLSAVQGLGKKTAERLCVELKSKITVDDSVRGSTPHGDMLSDVVDALVGLGYTKEHARAIIKELDAANATTEELLRAALKHVT